MCQGGEKGQSWLSIKAQTTHLRCLGSTQFAPAFRDIRLDPDTKKIPLLYTIIVMSYKHK